MQLIKAIEAGDMAVVDKLSVMKYVLNGKVDFTRIRDDGEEFLLKNWAPLHEAISHTFDANDTKILKKLLENGANVNIKDDDDETPLFMASK